MAVDFSCKGCKDRYVGCHSKCEKYKKEKEAVNKKHEIEKKNKSVVITQGSFLGNATSIKHRRERK